MPKYKSVIESILVIVSVAFLATVAAAAISISWNAVGVPHGNLKFNVNVGTEAEPDYYPLQVKLDMPRMTSDGHGKSQVTNIANVGTNRPTPFDFSTIEGLREVHEALPAWAKGMFKATVVMAIDEDPGT